MKFQYTNTDDDCRRCCIANVIQHNPLKVPNFVEKYGKQYYEPTRKRLLKHGYIIHRIYKTDELGFFTPGGVHIRVGYSIGGTNHAVVYLYNKIYYDPSNKDGLEGLRDGSAYIYFFITDKQG